LSVWLCIFDQVISIVAVLIFAKDAIAAADPGSGLQTLSKLFVAASEFVMSPKFVVVVSVVGAASLIDLT
jgi:hypothetical protein